MNILLKNIKMSKILSTINISSDRIIDWMNVIRDTSGNTQYRLLENFWKSQICSKAWLVNTIKFLNLKSTGDVYIFGGWYGVLASLIKDNFSYNNVYSIDVDPFCEQIGTKLDNRICFITSDMKEFKFDNNKDIGLVINTSTEHISNVVYQIWYEKIPNYTSIILQGNNFFSCNEHIRCSNTLDEFKRMNPLNVFIHEDELDCTQFIRYMTVGYKI